MEAINDDYRKHPDERRFNYKWIYRDRVEVDHISDTAQVRISTKRGVEPQFMVELGYLTPGSDPPKTIFETNPNNHDDGWKSVERVAYTIFGDAIELLKTQERISTLRQKKPPFNTAGSLCGSR
jgi:hypothetical protein